MKVATRLGLSFGMAALLLVLLMGLGGVTPNDVVDALRSLSPQVYLAAVGLHLTTYALRAARFRVLLPRALRPSWPRMFVSTAAHNMASYLLPAKTGEASYVVYLRMYGGVPPSRGLASLLVARFVDGAAMSLCLATAALVLHRSGDYPGLDWLGLLAGGLVAIGGLFLFFSMRGDLLAKCMRGVVRLVRLDRWQFGRALTGKLFTLGDALQVSGRKGRLATSFALTAPMCMTVYGFYWILARDMGMPDSVGLAEATFGSSLASFSNLLPVNGAAGAGTQELGWVTGFHKLLGVDFDLALSTGIGVHLVQLSNILLFGLVAHLVMGFLSHKSVPGSAEPTPAHTNSLLSPNSMTTSAIVVPLAEGFEEIEAITIIDVLRRADLTVQVVGLDDNSRVTGAHGIEVAVDGRLDDVDQALVLAVVLPGGMPGAKTLAEDARVLELLRATHAAGNEVAAICAAPIALEAAGLLGDGPATCYPGFQDQLGQAAFQPDARVVQHGLVTTSRGPGTSLEFALALVGRLASPEKAAELAVGMCAAQA